MTDDLGGRNWHKNVRPWLKFRRFQNMENAKNKVNPNNKQACGHLLFTKVGGTRALPVCGVNGRSRAQARCNRGRRPLAYFFGFERTFVFSMFGNRRTFQPKPSVLVPKSIAESVRLLVHQFRELLSCNPYFEIAKISAGVHRFGPLRFGQLSYPCFELRGKVAVGPFVTSLFGFWELSCSLCSEIVGNFRPVHPFLW